MSAAAPLPPTVTIAVDGPVAAGKGTLARRLAALYGYAYLDTGALYRAVGAKLLRAGGEPADLKAPDLRTEPVGLAASQVATIPAVREALLGYQRAYAARPPGGQPGAVLDGRDIGTVVCPAAAVKLFVTARADVRAARRHKELIDKGENVTYDQVLADLRRRDEQDRARAAAPLKPAADAHLLDTSDLDIEAAVAAAAEIVAATLKP